MKVSIYVEPSDGALGGAELTAAILAEALGHTHEVTLLHHRSSLSSHELAQFAGLELAHVATACVERAGDAWSHQSTAVPWRRFAEARRWHEELSRGADLFVNFTHRVPPFNHARLGILVVLFPLYDRRVEWPWTHAHERPGIRRTARRLYAGFEWRRRMATYGRHLAISEFTRGWTERRWGIRPSVLYPPVDTASPDIPKSNRIVSVGRFATLGVSKRQLELVQAFDEMATAGLDGWEYVCAGTLGTSTDDRSYFDHVRQAATSPRVSVRANLERDEVKGLLAGARVFWHAVGLNDAKDAKPDLSEHFGIVTAEAMAAGCVPVVINRGAQREIVTHGVDGFLCETLRDLQEYTGALARDTALLEVMSRAARHRAAAFTARRFLDGFSAETTAAGMPVGAFA